MAAAGDRNCRDIEECLKSMRQCFYDVYKMLTYEHASIPLDYYFVLQIYCWSKVFQIRIYYYKDLE